MNIRTCAIPLALACCLFAGQPAAPAAAGDLIFPHRTHIEEGGLECSSCHGAADSSRNATDNLLPSLRSCFSCHDSVETGWAGRASLVPRAQAYIGRFAHKTHTANAKISCLACHKGVEKSVTESEQYLPAMPVCVACHTNKNQPGYCFLCHLKGKKLLPRDHQGDYRATHGTAVYAKSTECTMCHSVDMCQSCHNKKNTEHKTHPLNYLNKHGVEANMKQENCLACHNMQTDCMACHRGRMVIPRSHESAGWALHENGGAHSRAAKNDLANCQACHNEASARAICGQCHVKETD